MVYMDATVDTTIKLHAKTKRQLDKWREYRRESYDDVIQKLVHIAETAREEPELSQEAVEAIEAARERIRAGKFVTEAEARKRLGL
ncbi:MAG: hypothetical protein V1728_03245 [Candidatus Micrarchaeota archaeon]